jgi:hypothetical protein
MTENIRKAIDRATEWLQEFSDALSDFARPKRLVGQPVPVRVNQ